MPFFWSLSHSDSQNFTCPCLELLRKVLAIGAASLLPGFQSRFPYPLPEFNIGDLVAYDWEPDDDDAPEFATDFGEVLGMRWVPEPDGHCLAANTWVYFVRWTHSTCPDILLKPCYDGEPTYSSDLRLVKHF
jgi:hypothetical protein